MPTRLKTFYPIGRAKGGPSDRSTRKACPLHRRTGPSSWNHSMTHDREGRERLIRLLELAGKESRVLRRSAERIERAAPDLGWVIGLEANEPDSEMLDAFVSRFGRLQDTLGNKVIPSLLREGLEPVGALLDNLARAEALEWVPSLEQWIVGRELRNRLIHEYMDSPEAGQKKGGASKPPLFISPCSANSTYC